MATYTKIAQMNAFHNADKDPGSNRPDWSNSRCKVDQDIPAGEYSLGIWKSEKGLSLKLEQRFEDATPEPATIGADDVIPDFEDV